MWREIRFYRRADLDEHDRVYRRWARRLMAQGKFLAVVAEDADGRPVGSGAIWRMPAQPRPGPLGRGEIPYILSMYTEPRWRGRGVATEIVQEMVRWSKAHRFSRIILHASRFGRPVYARLGFEDGSEMRLALDAAGTSSNRPRTPRGPPSARRRRGSPG